MSALADRLNGPVAVLLGGNSAERDISLQSGQTVLDGLAALDIATRAVDPADADWREQLAGAALVFIALHGPGGEDGSMQGALQVLGLPYTGAGVLGSALALDKQRCKQLWQGMGIATASFEMLSAETDWQAVIDRLGKVFVKPVSEGSSIGMSMADSAEALKDAYAEARRYGDTVLAEQFIDGPEYTVGILGGEALPAIRLETDNAFYDFDAKYVSDDTRYLCPCGLSAEEEAEIAAMSVSAFNALGCSVWGRVDLMRTASGEFMVLEVNTVPGMTSHSLVPMAAQATGMDIPALLARIVELSLEEDR